LFLVHRYITLRGWKSVKSTRKTRIKILTIQLRYAASVLLQRNRNFDGETIEFRRLSLGPAKLLGILPAVGAGWSWVRVLVGGRYSLLHQNVETISKAHQSLLFNRSQGYFLEIRRPGGEAHNSPIVPRLGMSGALTRYHTPLLRVHGQPYLIFYFMIESYLMTVFQLRGIWRWRPAGPYHRVLFLTVSPSWSV